MPGDGTYQGNGTFTIGGIGLTGGQTGINYDFTFRQILG
jgi:hypothetical protein